MSRNITIISVGDHAPDDYVKFFNNCIHKLSEYNVNKMGVVAIVTAPDGEQLTFTAYHKCNLSDKKQLVSALQDDVITDLVEANFDIMYDNYIKKKRGESEENEEEGEDG